MNSNLSTVTQKRKKNDTMIVFLHKTVHKPMSKENLVIKPNICMLAENQVIIEPHL
jgi:hypothetical protein